MTSTADQEHPDLPPAALWHYGVLRCFGTWLFCTRGSGLLVMICPIHKSFSKALTTDIKSTTTTAPSETFV